MYEVFLRYSSAMLPESDVLEVFENPKVNGHIGLAGILHVYI